MKCIVLSTILPILTLQPLLVAGVLPLYNPLIINTSVSFKAQGLTANDAVSLASIFNHADTSLAVKSGDYTAIASTRVDVGVSQKTLGYFGYTYRSDAFIHPNNDAMTFAYLVKFKKDIPLNKQYDIEISAEEYMTRGLTYSNAFEVYRDRESRVTLGIGGSFIVATDGQNATLSGHATSLGDKDYDFEAQLEYVYNRNLIYDYDVDSYTGYGFSTYVALEWLYRKFGARLIANDIGSKIYWDKLAYSTITATSDNKEYDDEGYPIYQPAIRGKEGYSSYVQKLTARYEAEVEYTFETRTLLVLGTDYYQNIYFPYLEVEQILLKNLSGSFTYEPYFNMFGVGLEYMGWGVEAKTNSLRVPSAVSLVLSGGYQF